ncbi:unnamed protein product [Ostreobium quekettii]|uniref:GAF domain-containing protein n=1 Tax=Ostreobium quekettii TaxID=121088 RepID=A0A8S1IZX5_9CHLO|nr:unnamed protein product [Ostreobium quekettii]|eukprot:evm.model.scf_2767.1 EVM.evm.TU.scf_2767.1   scf_2767:5006-8324(-)
MGQRRASRILGKLPCRLFCRPGQCFPRRRVVQAQERLPPRNAADRESAKPEAEFVKLMTELSDLSGGAQDAVKQLVSTIRSHLQVSFASVTAISSSSHSFVMLHAEGAGSAAIPQLLPSRFSQWSQHSTSIIWGAQKTIVAKMGSQDTAQETYPSDWALMYTTTGLNQFVGVPIQVGNNLVGTLCVGYTCELQNDWIPCAMEAAALWAYRYFERYQFAKIVQCMEAMATCRTINGLVKKLAKGILRFLSGRVHTTFACRLALSRPDLKAGIVFEEETINFHRKSSGSLSYNKHRKSWLQKQSESGICGEWEKLEQLQELLDQASMTRQAWNANSNTCVGEGRLESTFLGHRMLLDGTLLGVALESNASRLIEDCTAYVEVPTNPRKDIYISSKSQNIGSMLLAPMSCKGCPLGGVYLISASLMCSAHMMATQTELMNALQLLVPVLHETLQTRLVDEWCQLRDTVMRDYAWLLTDRRGVAFAGCHPCPVLNILIACTTKKASRSSC